MSQCEPDDSGTNNEENETIQDDEPATCAVCDEIIKEPTDDEPGDEAVYCEGICEFFTFFKALVIS